MAVTVARQPDGTPMFITGCAAGMVLRWDAASGNQIGPPLPGTHRFVLDLTVVDLPDGRQLLAALDDRALYRWDPVTGMSPAPVPIAGWKRFVAAQADRDGHPVAFVHFPAEFDEPEEGWRVERWRLDRLTRVEPDLPATLRAVFDDAGATWMVLSELDASLVIRPLPPIPEEPVPEGLW